MRKGAILSGLLHGTVILLLLVGLPELFRRDLEPPPVIPIEIVNIADITQAPDLKVKPKVDGPETKKEEKPEPPKPTPVVEKTPEPEPVKEPEPTPEPEVTMDDLLAPVEEEKKKEEKKKEEKPKEKPKEKKKKKAKPKKDFMKLLNNIDKTEASADGPAQKDQDENSTSDHAANNINATLSITELDLIRRQLAACWNVPAGAQDAKDLYVDVKVEMNPDATVQSAVVTGSSGGGSYKRAAEDSALRAVRNPKCSPLKLPLQRYDQWKTITIRFDPQHIL